MKKKRKKTNITLKDFWTVPSLTFGLFCTKSMSQNLIRSIRGRNRAEGDFLPSDHFSRSEGKLELLIQIEIRPSLSNGCPYPALKVITWCYKYFSRV